jgi:hypothetical protein
MTRDELLNLLHTENLLKFSEAAMSLYAENERLREERDKYKGALEFVWSRVEDNATAWELDNTERGWRATFEYEELFKFDPRDIAADALRATPAGEGRDA